MTDSYRLPELTRGLRVFGAPAALGGVQERLFAPLLEARRAAARATRWQDRLAAFDADRLETTLRSVVQSVAEDRHPDSAADRRALAAQLADTLDATIVSLRRSAAVADDVRRADDDTRPELWQRWLRSLAPVFSEADLALERAIAILGPGARAYDGAKLRSNGAGTE